MFHRNITLPSNVVSQRNINAVRETVQSDNSALVASVPENKATYDAIWNQWIQDAPPEERRNREIEASRMCTCLEGDIKKLNLNYLELSALPEYLPGNKVSEVTWMPDFESLLNQIKNLPTLNNSLR